MTLKLAELTPERIARWIESERKKRPTSAASSFRLLRAFVNWTREVPEYKGSVPTDARTARAVRDVFDKPLIQRCQQHKIRNVRDKLPEKLKVVAEKRMRQAYHAESALKAEPATKGVFIQASESSTGAEHDVKSIGEIVKKTDAVFVVDAITGLGTMPLDVDGWCLAIVIGGSQKAFMIPPGLAFLSVSAKAWKKTESATLPHYYFDLKKEKKNGDLGESTWTPAVSLILAMAEALKYVKQIGMANLIANAQLLARAPFDGTKPVD